MIPGYGVYLWNNDSSIAPLGWNHLTGAWAQSLSVSEFGNGVVVVASIPGYGTYAYTTGYGWAQLTPAVTSHVAVDGPYTVADIPGYGVYLYNNNANGWTHLTSVDASALAVDSSGDVVGDFYNYGVYENSGGGWYQLTRAVASQIAINSRGQVFVELPGYGVHLFDPASGWSALTPSTLDATSLAMNNNGYPAASFYPWGTYILHNDGVWEKISGAAASQVNVDAAGDIIGEFPGYGIWLYDGSTWSQLTGADASLTATDR